MKKFIVIGFAMIMAVTFFAGSAMAVDHSITGELRTRAYTNGNWDGDNDSEWGDYRAVDMRARLYYTAGITEGLSVNMALELGDVIWGENYDPSGGYFDQMDVGVDDQLFEVKHLNMDFDWGATNWIIGAQELVVSRGFMLWDDFYSANMTWNAEAISTQFLWARLREGYAYWDAGGDVDEADVDLIGAYPTFTVGDKMTIVPGLMWAHSGDLGDPNDAVEQKHDSYYLSVDLDYAFDDAAGLWFTGIYKGGTETDITDTDIDFSAWLVAIGGNTYVGDFEVHGQAFYATGDDDPTDDEDNYFSVVNTDGYSGQSYYWAEIMGYGWFDYNYTPTNTPSDQIGNVWAVNLGTTIPFTDKTSLILDVWKAELVEKNIRYYGASDNVGETDLGIEIDARLSTQIIPDYLYLDLIAAYLFAGDAVSTDGNNDENPYEAGAYLAVYF